ncbi:MAG: demethylphylloquinol methyltransferase [Acidobacteriota bacterium]|jgi:demethylmenaquinone methyltransferase/2-methoxy-6-polyprenyl-1,4-benzoquinol methylase
MAPASTLRNALATPDGKRSYVRRLFATIADRYDLITVLLSYGQDRRWKRRLLNLSGVTARTRVLDVACGTGDLAFAAARRGADVTGLDVTHRMVQLATARRVQTGLDVRFVVGDMAALPFRDQEFDVVTTGYGIRNVPEIAPAIREISRVLRPGGVLLSLDFNRPDNRLLRAVYLAYLTAVGSALGFVLHRDPDTYRYIPESIRRYPGARVVRELIEANGFAMTRHLPVLGGLMAIHTARK